MVHQIRDDILRSAAQLFGEVGYDRARLEDLARALGMKKGSLYYHIDAKEDLLFSIHDRLIDELTSQTVIALNAAQGGEERVRAVLRAAMRLIADHRQEVTVFLHERHAFDSERWSSIRAKRDSYEALVSDVLAFAVGAGEFRPVPTALATKGLLGMVNWGYQWFDPNGDLDPDQVADVFADLVLYGLVRDRQKTSANALTPIEGDVL